MNSTVMLASNLMIDDEQHRPEYRYMPGDYVARLHRNLADVRSRHLLSERQLFELEQYLLCIKCGRACAGTCED